MTSPASAEIRVSFSDVVQGRAYLRIPFVGKLLLAHWAGAPWSDKDASACLHALQVEVVSRREREKIVHGASRLGKSVLGGIDLITAAMLPFRKFAAIADRYQHVGHEWQYLFAGLRTLFKQHPQAFKRLSFKRQQNYFDAECDTVWGTVGAGLSVASDEGAQLLGRELTDAVLGEGSHVSADIFNTKLLRALDGATMKRAHGGSPEIGTLSIYTTPRGYEGCSASEWERIKKLTKNDPTKLHYGNVPWAQTAWVREASILENPAYSRDVFAARKATLDPRAFQEQYLGKMTFASGRVYQSFNEDRHVIPMPSADNLREMRFALGIDTGAYTAFVLVSIDRAGRKYILAETYAEKPAGGIYTAMEWAEEMLVEALAPLGPGLTAGKILSDTLYLVSIDPASQHKPEIIDRWDVALTSPNTNDQRSLIATIDRVEKWFQAGELLIADGCQHTIDQIRKYQWKTMKHPSGVSAPVVKEPHKGYDHLLDAFRFALIPLADHGLPTEPASISTWAETWEAQRRERVFGPLRAALEHGRAREERLRARR